MTLRVLQASHAALDRYLAVLRAPCGRAVRHASKKTHVIEEEEA